MQGRSAVYSTRQLLQIVAVKRLQAQGLSLATIQAELGGAPNSKLRTIAAISDELGGTGPATESPVQSERRSRFWAEPPAETSTNGAGDDSVTTLAAVTLPGGALLLLPCRPDDQDIQAIRGAARPLLDLLADRGLLRTDERSSS